MDKLQVSLNDPIVPLPARKAIPSILARIATPSAAAVLANSLIQGDPGLRYDVLKALNQLRRTDPALLPTSPQIANVLDVEVVGFQRSFQILAALDPEAGSSTGSLRRGDLVTQTLRERMDHELERIFRLLALLYPPRDVYNIYAGLNSRRPRLQANSLEMLEHLLEPDLYKRLSSALDPETSLQEKLEFAERLCRVSVESRVEALRILLNSEDRWMRTCALYTVGQCHVLEVLSEVRGLPHDADSLITQNRAWTEARLAATADR